MFLIGRVKNKVQVTNEGLHLDAQFLWLFFLSSKKERETVIDEIE